MSASSLHRESTDSLIESCIDDWIDNARAKRKKSILFSYGAETLTQMDPHIAVKQTTGILEC